MAAGCSVTGQAGALGFQRLQFLNKTFHGFVTIADRRDDAVDLNHHAVELPFGIVAVDADRLLPFGPPLMIGARQFEQCLTVGKLVLDAVKDGALQGLQAIASAVVAVFPTVRVRAYHAGRAVAVVLADDHRAIALAAGQKAKK
jgi:hypothetical protein